MKKKLPKDLLAKLNAVTKKRPKTVIQFIIEHGFITTDDLTKLGYKHPPRAARDVREQGIPLETFRVKDSTGKSIGAYRFGNPKKAGLNGSFSQFERFFLHFPRTLIDLIS